MSWSVSAWVWTKTSRHPAAAAASSSATRRSDTSVGWWPPAARRSAAGCGAVGRGWCPGHRWSRSCPGPGNRPARGWPSAGKSRCTTATVSWSIPNELGVQPVGRRASAGESSACERSVLATSSPAKALTSALFPTPVPPIVATTRGDSRRSRISPTRSRRRRTSAGHVRAGCQGATGRPIAPTPRTGRPFRPTVPDGPVRGDHSRDGR